MSRFAFYQKSSRSYVGSRREGGETGGREARQEAGRPMRGLLQWSRQFIHLCPWRWRGEGWEDLAGV